MRRMRLFFAGLLFLGLIFLWRLLDYMLLFDVFKLREIASSLCFIIFLLLPISLAIKLEGKKQKLLLFLGSVTIIVTFFSTPGLSRMATDNPDHGHCGISSYTGVLYPLRLVLTDAHKDDLEARNQMCWMKKIIDRVPQQFEYGQYMKLIHARLLRPERKYRTTFPLITWLFFRINMRDDSSPANLASSLAFWKDQYTEEISARAYPWWNIPHSLHIQWEYGLVEKILEILIEEVRPNP